MRKSQHSAQKAKDRALETDETEANRVAENLSTWTTPSCFLWGGTECPHRVDTELTLARSFMGN